jgi:hypothetical protein
MEKETNRLIQTDEQIEIKRLDITIATNNNKLMSSAALNYKAWFQKRTSLIRCSAD